MTIKHCLNMQKGQKENADKSKVVMLGGGKGSVCEICEVCMCV